MSLCLLVRPICLLCLFYLFCTVGILVCLLYLLFLFVRLVRPSYDPQTLRLVIGYFSIYQFSAIYCNKAKYNLEMFGGQSYAKCADF